MKNIIFAKVLSFDNLLKTGDIQIEEVKKVYQFRFDVFFVSNIFLPFSLS